MMRRIVPVLCLAIAAIAAQPLPAQNLFDPQSSEIHSSNDISSNGSIAAMLNPVQGQPYEASKVTRSVWRLMDGTTITHESETKIARDGEGRVREDIQNTHAMSVGGKQINGSMESVTVVDPVDHSLTTWTGTAKLAFRMELPDFSGAMKKAMPGGGVGGIVGVAPPPRPRVSGSVNLGSPVASLAAGGEKSGDEVKTEELGKQSLAGVLVTEKRTTTVIARGKIGNDQPITIVHEEWYSPDLKVVVKSVDSDPRSGERTMELVGLERGDPDAALFHAPAGYEVKDMAGMMKTLGNLGKTAPSDK